MNPRLGTSGLVVHEPQAGNLWFSSYPIALISKAEGQEDIPYFIAPFICCCDPGVNFANILLQQLQHFAFFSCCNLLFMVLIYC